MKLVYRDVLEGLIKIMIMYMVTKYKLRDRVVYINLFCYKYFIFKVLGLSVPCVRIILIRQARPMLASHAPNDKMIKVLSASK